MKHVEAQVILRRDGTEVMRGTEETVWRWIHQNHCYSVDHALKHEGYTMTQLRFETETYTAPACWASYLINGDASGLDYYNTPDDPQGDREIAAADAFIESVGLGSPVDCSEESEFCGRPDYSTDGKGGDCLTYSFIRQVEEPYPVAVAP